ncbi:polysaccharide biosynthesis tyrosine autokinase [Rhizobium sp. CC-YZS058]|nr:polysaccharide biosynthesis tyrosine autokinase [Rhizobium sp. CC-YZS058]MEA3535437.1 polysaccharide biosynthesis tyrosine autokinase [Rhizobium sp. CC-YZS058]
MSSTQEDRRGSESTAELIDLDSILRVARRQWMLVALGLAAGAVVGLIYIFTAVPLYTASTSILIDRGNREVIEQLTAPSMLGEDEATVLSEVELLKSDSIALSVVDKLDLTNEPLFTAPKASALSAVRSMIRSAISLVIPRQEGAVDREQLRQGVAASLQANLGVMRVGRTYVLEVSYTSPSSALSARVVNAFSDAYLVDKLNAKYEATRRAGTWLQDRIAELRQKALETDLAVQKFRSANGLVSMGTGTTSTLISDQKLSELNSALIEAQGQTARMRARYESVQAIIASGRMEAIVTDVLGSSVSNDLRQKYLEASKREAEISARLGPNHEQAVRLRSEMSEYRRLLFEELNRIGQSYKSDLDVAEAQERSLAESVSSATGVSALASETQVQLRELEREAETYKNLYQTFLERYQATVQQQSFPITEARVITAATQPTIPSHPKKPLALALFIILGIAAGSLAGAFREFRDRFFRTGEQVRDSLELEFLGTAPLVPSKDLAPPKVVDGDPRAVRKISSIYSYTTEHPLSSFAETLRSVKIAADLSFPGKDCKIIGVISALPGEGKSTVSINLAELLASQGSRTLLIDADLRNPGATRAMGQHANEGLMEVLLEQTDVKNVVLHNPATGLRFLPAVIKHRVPHSSELLGSAAMRKLLTDVSGFTDYIIVDLPPLGPVVDARAIAPRLDGFLFVTEWGKTARRVVKHLLDVDPIIREKCLGVVLNKVDQEKMKLYRTYGSTEFYQSRYMSYYQDGK